MQRQNLIQSWLETLFPYLSPVLTPASADASFRRYFRTNLSNGEHYIVMDAPPQHEDCGPFVFVAELFAAAGLNVPRVLQQNLQQGFLLLTDLGDETYLSRLNRLVSGHDTTVASAGADVHTLYTDATDALIRIQLASEPAKLPEYDRALLARELQLFPEWYVAKHLNISASPDQMQQLQTVFARLLDNNLAQERVFVHRDYHSRNLMVTSPNPGILDFQDAVYGPITYDLVSLLKDAYISWDEERVLDWAIRYWEKARRARLPVPADFADFYRDFEWMGMQRHLKVLGIFARLCHRDGKTAYVADMPLVLDYVRRTAARYAEFGPLLRLLDQWQGATADSGYTF
ncbi:MAG: aminoglycoside phosphotransferase family protein [Burkholderiales bacterium]